MKISVLLTTYNGEKYIEEQLRSIFEQTRQPDEVLICDDCSKDSTREIVDHFIKSNGLSDRWNLLVNTENLGLWANSHRGVLKTTGDIFFWADQDDVWLPSKIEKMSRAFEENSEVLALSCGYALVDEALNKIHSKFIKKSSETGEVKHKSLSYALNTRNLAAQSLAVRKSLYLEMAEKFSDPYMFFDTMLISYAAAKKGYYYIDSTLTLYRQHSNNVSSFVISPEQMTNPSYSRTKAVESQLKMMETRTIMLQGVLPEKEYMLLKNAAEIVIIRFDAVKGRDIFKLIPLLFSPNKFVNKKWVLADMYYLFKKYLPSAHNDGNLQ